ncbi:unnamed protein product [Danaus chrysippus]|uniref:(African queen) hypothetical protein n=1 Tax=Danaus chrysippus TaxID=151541 RepID=A0A8J2QMY0_9NEOP|nr:unnamed protein product [Danaus chrysippus]
MLKLWLGLALTADSSALFRGSNSFGMSLKRPSELYKHLRVSKRYILGKSHDDIVTSLPKDEDAPELESRLQFHKQFMIGAQSNRAGLGSNRKVRIKLKSFIRVLEVIREAVSLSVARAQKAITTNERSVGFVREGTRATKLNVKPYSILKAASDWTIMMDTYEKQYKIPEDICASASRPYIFLFSRILKRVVLIELTVPWETNIPKDHTIKVNKYYELTNELTRNRFVVDLYAVEVGARGITAKSLYNLLKDLGLSRTHNNAFLERISKAALVGSFQIWLGRERSLDSGGERITRVS